MTATVIDGKQIAEQTRAEAATGALALRTRTGVIPHLAAVLVGEDPASAEVQMSGYLLHPLVRMW